MKRMFFMFERSSGGLVLCNIAPKNNNNFFLSGPYVQGTKEIHK
jgi:hypothetical protein